jgi:hypothetical protein
MAKNYKHLTTQERAVVMTMREVQAPAAPAFTTLTSPTRSAMPDA